MIKNLLFFTSDTNMGGTETNLLKIGAALKERGYHIYHLSFYNRGPLFKEGDSVYSKTQCIGPYSRRPIRVLASYKKFLNENKIDVIFNFGIRVEVFSRLFSRMFRPVRMISNIRSTDDWRKWYHILVDTATSYVPDIWVSNSEAARKKFHEREGILLEKIMVIYNFIEAHQPLPFNSFTNRKTPVVIGVLANIRPAKGHQDLPELCRLLIHKQFNHRFLLAGKDFTNGDFYKKIQSSGLSSYFDILGYTGDKQSFFERIDMLLMPSYWEGLPTSILESQSYGRPVIASSVGGIPEIITDNINGFLCRPADVACMADRIMKTADDETAKRFIKNGYKILKAKFDRDTAISKWIEAIEG